MTLKLFNLPKNIHTKRELKSIPDEKTSNWTKYLIDTKTAPVLSDCEKMRDKKCEFLFTGRIKKKKGNI